MAFVRKEIVTLYISDWKANVDLHRHPNEAHREQKTNHQDPPPGDQNPYSMTATAKISALIEMSKEMGRSPAERRAEGRDENLSLLLCKTQCAGRQGFRKQSQSQGQEQKYLG